MQDEFLTFYDDFSDWIEQELDRLDISHYPQEVRESTFRDIYPTIDDLYSSYKDHKFGDQYIVEVTYRDRLDGKTWSKDEVVKGINPSRAKEQVMIKSHMLVMSQILDMEVLTDDR